MSELKLRKQSRSDLVYVIKILVVIPLSMKINFFPNFEGPFNDRNIADKPDDEANNFGAGKVRSTDEEGFATQICFFAFVIICQILLIPILESPLTFKPNILFVLGRS